MNMKGLMLATLCHSLAVSVLENGIIKASQPNYFRKMNLSKGSVYQ